MGQIQRNLEKQKEILSAMERKEMKNLYFCYFMKSRRRWVMDCSGRKKTKYSSMIYIFTIRVNDAQCSIFGKGIIVFERTKRVIRSPHSAVKQLNYSRQAASQASSLQLAHPCGSFSLSLQWANMKVRHWCQSDFSPLRCSTLRCRRLYI